MFGEEREVNRILQLYMLLLYYMLHIVYTMYKYYITAYSITFHNCILHPHIHTKIHQNICYL